MCTEDVTLAMQRICESKRAARLLGAIRDDHGLPPLKGEVGEKFASFSFDITGEKASGVVQVAAQRVGTQSSGAADSWKLLKVRVRAMGCKIDLV